MGNKKRPFVHRKRVTLRDKMAALRYIEKDRSKGMLITHACKKRGIPKSCYYLWKKYVKEKTEEKKIGQLYNYKSDQTRCVTELRYLEHDILSFIYEKKELGVTLTARLVVDFVKSKDERFREKTDQAQFSQIHRFLKAHDILLPTRPCDAKKKRKLVEDVTLNFVETNREKFFSGQSQGNAEKDQEDEEEYDRNERKKIIKSKRGKIKSKRGTDYWKKVSFNSSVDKISSATSGDRKTSPNKNKNQRDLLEEVKLYSELLHKFEGIIPKEDLDKRKKALFLALPPVSLPNVEKIAPPRQKM